MIEPPLHIFRVTPLTHDPISNDAMKKTLQIESISLSTFEDALKGYAIHVPPELNELDQLRYNHIPETLQQRRENGGEVYLEKAEVTKLVDWKLKHGTYRPNLAKLIASNSEETIRENTKKAFATYEADRNDHAKPMKVLCELKGIGPATASLLLSCYDPVNVPFFSDELYRYSLWGEAKHHGWDRKINYNPKAYRELSEEFEVFRDGFKKKGKTIRAVDLEKVAYVIAKEAKQEKAASQKDHVEETIKPPASKRRKKETAE